MMTAPNYEVERLADRTIWKKVATKPPDRAWVVKSITVAFFVIGLFFSPRLYGGSLNIALCFGLMMFVATALSFFSRAA